MTSLLTSSPYTVRRQTHRSVPLAGTCCGLVTVLQWSVVLLNMINTRSVCLQSQLWLNCVNDSLELAYVVCTLFRSHSHWLLFDPCCARLCVYSTRRRVPRAVVSRCRAPEVASKTSAARPSSSATARAARVTTSPTSTASG